MLINSEVVLHGATEVARAQFEEAVQDYAERLADESEKQEISSRPPGTRFSEVSANSVARAKAVIDRYGQRAKPTPLEVAALAGLPILSGATGVMGSYLTNTLNWAIFSLLGSLAISCVAILATRRLL
jgi:hypothetical protein